MGTTDEILLEVGGFGRYQLHMLIWPGAGIFAYAAIWVLLPTLMHPLDLESGFSLPQLTLSETLQFAAYAGSAPIFSWAADIYGRKRVSCISPPLAIIATVLGTLPVPEEWRGSQLIVFRLLTGCCLGTITGPYLQTLESIQDSLAPSVSTGLMCGFAVWGAGASMLASYLAGYPRHVTMWAMLAPMPVVLAGVMLFTGESPKLLIAKGQYQEAEALLQRIARVNSVDYRRTLVIDAALCSRVRGDGAVSQRSVEVQDATRGPRVHRVSPSVVFLPQALTTTLPLIFSWFVLSLVYYGLAFAAGTMGPNLYVGSALLSLSDIPGNLLPLVIGTRLPQYLKQAVFFAVSGLVLVFLCVMSDSLTPSWSTGLAVTGKLFCEAAFSNVYVVTAERYPPELRGFALGMCSFGSRVGLLLAPTLQLAGLAGLSGVCGAFALVASLAQFALPKETSRMMRLSEELLVDPLLGS